MRRRAAGVFGASGGSWLARSIWFVVPALVVLATAAPLSADVVVNPFAGSWGTFGNTGTLNLQVVDAGKGAAAVSVYSGGSAATLCPPPTVFYTGSYQVGSGDAGQIAGCTSNGNIHLKGWYKSSSGPQRGTIDIDIQSGGTSFKGGYVEQSNGTKGDYSGTFKADFPGSGRTQPSPPTTTTTPAPIGGRAQAASGPVEVQLPHDTWHPLTAGTPLPLGSRVHTGFKGHATIFVAGRGTVILGPMTLLLVAPNGVLLHLGDVDVSVPRKGQGASDFEVKTATVAASDRGTKFSVHSHGGLTTVKVTGHAVYVKPANRRLKPVTVKAGYQVMVSKSRISPITRLR
jgi:FecR protein